MGFGKPGRHGASREGPGLAEGEEGGRGGRGLAVSGVQPGGGEFAEKGIGGGVREGSGAGQAIAFGVAGAETSAGLLAEPGEGGAVEQAHRGGGVALLAEGGGGGGDVGWQRFRGDLQAQHGGRTWGGSGGGAAGAF